MAILNLLTIDTAEGKAKQLLTAVKQMMGKEINLMSAMANAPAALEGYLSLSSALAGGALHPRLREQLAVVTAGYNQCNYCASAHTFLGSKAGIDEIELDNNLKGRSADFKTQVALSFALKLIEHRGQVDAEDIDLVRQAGYSDEEIIEILAHVALNTFTNYFNVAFDTEIDFPQVNAHQREAV